MKTDLIKKSKNILKMFFIFFFIELHHNSAISDELNPKDIYTGYRCTKCHSMKVENIEPLEEELMKGKKIVDHSGVGLKHSSEWIKRWLLKQEEKDGKKHRIKFKGTEEELEILSNWLGEKKTEIPEQEIKKWYAEIIKRIMNRNH